MTQEENLAVTPTNETPVTSEINENELPKEEKSKKPSKKYNGAATASHLLVVLFSAIIIAAMVIPVSPYMLFGGFASNQFVPLLEFPLSLFALAGPLPGFTSFMNEIAPMLNTMLGISDKMVLIIMTSVMGVGLVMLLISLIYSFVCLVGGIGKKHAYKLAYVAFAGTLLVFAFPFIFMIIGLVGKNANVIYPIESAIAYVLAIGLVITCHVLYAKKIKHADEKVELTTETATTSLSEVEQTIMKDFAGATAEGLEIDKDVIDETKQEECPQIQEEEIEETPMEEVIEDHSEEVTPSEEVKSEPEVVAPIKEEKPAEESVIHGPSKVSYDLTKGIPSDIEELGDHQFSKNLDIEVAIIPEGIEKIGPACFANCLNLKAVHIPTSVTKISFNAFFACKKLVKISYAGSKVEWKKIIRGSNWLTSAGTKVVVCKDGAISVNPFH